MTSWFSDKHHKVNLVKSFSHLKAHISHLAGLFQCVEAKVSFHVLKISVVSGSLSGVVNSSMFTKQSVQKVQKAGCQLVDRVVKT